MTLEQNYKGNIIHYSLHSILSQDEIGFDLAEYSRFKHGSEDIARKFGYNLADGFIKNCLSKHYKGEQLVILQGAHSHIPTAAFCMKRYFVDNLNDYLFRNYSSVVEELKIYRSVSYREDYGEMSAKQRYDLIKDDNFYFDRNFLGNKTIIHLDDIKITGTHEQIIVNLLNEYELNNNCYFLFFAELQNKLINPKIENYLNNYLVKGLDNIDAIIKQEQFCFNTRVVKYILNSNSESFDSFIKKQTGDFIRDLYYNAIGNEYFKFSEYQRNLNILRQII
jgi:signal peptidase I